MWDVLKKTIKLYWKTLKNEISREIPCSWDRVFNILKSSSLSQIICRSCTDPVKTQKVFCELYKLFLNFIWKSKGPRIAKRLLKIINKVCVCGGWGMAPHYIKIYYRPA